MKAHARRKKSASGRCGTAVTERSVRRMTGAYPRTGAASRGPGPHAGAPTSRTTAASCRDRRGRRASAARRLRRRSRCLDYLEVNPATQGEVLAGWVSGGTTHDGAADRWLSSC
jgi:hypothetical protein